VRVRFILQFDEIMAQFHKIRQNERGLITKENNDWDVNRLGLSAGAHLATKSVGYLE